MYYDLLPSIKTITIKEDTTFGLFAKAQSDCDVVINVNDNVTFNLYTLITCVDGKSNTKIHINCGSDTKINIISKIIDIIVFEHIMCILNNYAF